MNKQQNKRMIPTETLQSKQIAFLDETVAYYKTHPRGVSSKTHRCSYQAGCAIGRHLDGQLAAKLDRYLDRYDDATVSNPALFERLPPTLQELDMEFLKDVQALHDIDDNWMMNNLGGQDLSPLGHIEFDLIKEQYML